MIYCKSTLLLLCLDNVYRNSEKWLQLKALLKSWRGNFLYLIRINRPNCNFQFKYKLYVINKLCDYLEPLLYFENVVLVYLV